MNNLEKRILFVGGGTPAQARLLSELKASNPAWSAVFSQAAKDALAILDQAKVDAVVTDDTLPDMDGFTFLNSVQERHPESHRLIVCEMADSNAGLKTTRVAHHCVPKPWESEAVRDVLERAFERSVWLSSGAVRGLVQRMPVLPSPPTLYFEIVKALRSDEADLEDIFRRAAQDPALTAKLLQVANSAVLGLRHKVTSAEDAIGYLGLETTRSLVLLGHTFSYCDKARTAGFSIEGLWGHSLTVGAIARKIAREEKEAPEVVDESFLAGLLHDIGKLLLAVNMPDQYSRVIARVREAGPPSSKTGNRLTLWQAENEEFGTNHGEIGAELMAIWNLPMTVVEALAMHHRPTKLLSSTFSPLTAVHVADVFSYEFSGTQDPLEYAEIDTAYLSDLGLFNNMEAWRTACQEEFQNSDEVSHD